MELSHIIKRISLLIFISNIILINFLIFSYLYQNYPKPIILAHENLKKHHISNFRVINDGNDCNKNEIALSIQIKQGSIEKPRDTKKLIKLCYEFGLYSSFYYISNSFKFQQKTDLLADESCQYNGMKYLPPKESSQCPVSDIIFSHEEEEINGYERIGNKDDQGINIFIKRSDEKMTPLVAIEIIKYNELSFLQSSLNLTFSMTEICEQQYSAYESICSNDTELNELEYRIVKENQIALDLSCHNALLAFNEEQTKHPFFKSKETIYSTVFDLILVISASCILFGSKDRLKENLKTIFEISSIFISVFFIWKFIQQYQLYSELDYLHEAVSTNCYTKGNPLEFLISDLRFHYLLIHISILFSLSSFSMVIFNPVKKLIIKCLPQSYQRFDNQEMVPI